MQSFLFINVASLKVLKFLWSANIFIHFIMYAKPGRIKFLFPTKSQQRWQFASSDYSNTSCSPLWSTLGHINVLIICRTKFYFLQIWDLDSYDFILRSCKQILQCLGFFWAKEASATNRVYRNGIIHVNFLV